MSNYIVIGNYQTSVKIAMTEEELSQGLQNISWPPPAMAFIFAQPGLHKFWMKQTPSPLDLVFCRDKKIIAIANGTPNCLDLLGPNSLSDLVVELPAGTVQRERIRVGQTVRLQMSIAKLANWLELRCKSN
jgi:uncharacterized membrane protein (UPF0127 family)